MLPNHPIDNFRLEQASSLYSLFRECFAHKILDRSIVSHPILQWDAVTQLVLPEDDFMWQEILHGRLQDILGIAALHLQR